MRQKLIELQGEIDESTITVGDFITSLSKIDISAGRISKDIVEFTPPSINWKKLTSIDYLTTEEYTFFSNSHGTLTEIDHILDLKAHLKFKRIKTTQCLLSDHNGIKLETNNRKIAGKCPQILGD